MEYNKDDKNTILTPIEHDPNSYALNGKIMLCSVIILFIAVVVMFCFHSHASYFFHHHQRRSRSRSRSRSHHTTTANTSVISFQGKLDISIIKTIPTFVYSSKTHDPLLECAVCLSEFEDNEKGRVLPKCNHTFHIHCIDMWFSSHSNCPLCRAPVHPSPEISDEVIISVTEPAESSSESCQREEGEMGRPPPLPPVFCSTKSLELMGIFVELPIGDHERFRSLQELGLGSPTGRVDGFKSPANRILSLKRICSI